MYFSLKRLALASVAACTAFAAAAPVYSQQYPTKPVRVIVPFAPGGGSDITARQFSNKLSEYMGQQFVVENRGGAGGLIGMEATARSTPDGYTIMMMSASFAATSAVRQPKFDPINSIVPVAEFGYTPFVLTLHPSLPAKTTKELIALARTTKGGLSYAGTGTGGATHLATELFSLMAKVKMVAIQYKSTGAAMSDLLSGQVPVIVGSLLPVTPHLKTGRLRGLAVTTAKRWHTLPDVPTIAETVPGYEVTLWFGTMAPRGTPEPIMKQLNAAINKALGSEDIKKNLAGAGMIGNPVTPEQFGKRIRDDYERYVKVAKEANIQIN
jgi:tripartite-type tricarboxylate transporter receptor subunit TctC